MQSEEVKIGNTNSFGASTRPNYLNENEMAPKSKSKSNFSSMSSDQMPGQRSMSPTTYLREDDEEEKIITS